MPDHFTPRLQMIRSIFGMWLAISLSMPLPLLAAPMIDAGDELARHHLQVLSDGGFLRIPLSTWPLPWASVNQEMRKIPLHALSTQQRWSYRYLQHELRKARSSIRVMSQSNIGTGLELFSGFGGDFRNQTELGTQVEWTGQRFSAKLSGRYIDAPLDQKSWVADGSQIDYLVGNWAVGVGSVERWWGPGWENSLILGNSARPLPALYLQRHQAKAFDSPWLAWLGHWQASTFMAELESSQHYPKPWLWGLRLNSRVSKHLEIGLSRTAIWGGDGRPHDGTTFVNLLVGRDNRGDGGIAEDASNEPGNQLAGIDFRWHFNWGPLQSALYSQWIGEDEAGAAPSKLIGLGGVETSGLWWDMHWRGSLEASNTSTEFYEDAALANTAYEHSIYIDGYRHRHRPLGASTDNDSETLTLRGLLHRRNGHTIQASLAQLDLNVDNTNLGTPGGSAFESVRTYRASIAYAAAINHRTQIQLTLSSTSAEINFHGEPSGSGVSLSTYTRW